MAQSHISASMFPATTQYYTQYKGIRCALPLLADAYGLYYNKTLFKAAGITSPPKTMSELTADAKKLTEQNSDGTIKVAGFDPVDRLLREHPGAVDHVRSAASGWTPSGKSILSKRSRLDEVADLAEEPRRLVRVQQPRAASRPGAVTSSPRRRRSRRASSR